MVDAVRQWLFSRFLAAVVLGVAVIAAGVVVERSWRWSAAESLGLAAVKARVEALALEVERARAGSLAVADAYAPAVAGRIDDLSAAAVEMLRQLPSAVGVEVHVVAPKPARRIIHLRDWHFVPPELYALDLRQTAGKPLSDAEIALLQRELLLQVELVSLEHAVLLACLVKHHGLRCILSEGLTPQGLPQFQEVIAELRDVDRGIAGLQKQRAGLKGKADALDNELRELMDGFWPRLLEYGAVGRLAIDNAIEVLPLDDEQLLEQAKPVKPDGTLKLDPAKLEARHDGQVKAALASGPVSFIVLGAAHDLPPNIQKLDGSTEYIRVTTNSVARFADRR